MRKAEVNGKRLGQNIAERRRSNGLTQEALARCAGCARTTIVRLEQGNRQPSVEMLFRIAAALDCRASELVKGI